MKALGWIISICFFIFLIWASLNPDEFEQQKEAFAESFSRSYNEAVEQSSSSSTSSAKSETFGYAKIECGGSDGAVDDYDWNTLVVQSSLQLSLSGHGFLDPDELNEYDKKALRDAMRYVRSHETNLINNGLYYITLYKHYYSEDDKDGWGVVLRYSRREDDFTFLIMRI
ncbi:MAG: hypothetical protein K6G18_12330 [Treponema sp.]|nr:hypothetical protein [Treponema sp.]